MIQSLTKAIRRINGTSPVQLKEKAKSALVKRIDYYLEWGEQLESSNHSEWKAGK